MTLREAPDARGLAALILGASLLGFAAMLVRWAAPASPLLVGFYRMAFALPLVAVLAWRSRTPGPVGPRLWALLAGACFVADLWMWHTALRLTSAANATLLVTLAPIWVALVSVFWLGARLRRRFWTGMALATAGALVLGLAQGARLGTGLGELLGALASLAYAAFTLALGRARRNLNTLEALFWVVLCCTVLFGVLGWTRGEAFSGYPPRAWWALLALGVGGAGGGLVAHHLGPGPCAHQHGRHGPHDPACGHGHPRLAAPGRSHAPRPEPGRPPGVGRRHPLRPHPTGAGADGRSLPRKEKCLRWG